MLDPDDDLLLLTHPKLQAMKIGRGGTGTRPTLLEESTGVCDRL